MKRPVFQGPGFADHRVSEWQWVLATVLRFVAVLLVIAAVVYLVRAFLSSRPGTPHLATPFRSPGLDELDMRYARGEVKWLLRTHQGRWIPYAALYEGAKMLGLVMGANHQRLPAGLKRRLSAIPPAWDGRGA